MGTTEVHVHTGGPKSWFYGVRRKWKRRWSTRKAPDKLTARRRMLAWLARDPQLVEGVVCFTQEYYDPEAVVRVRVGHR